MVPKLELRNQRRRQGLGKKNKLGFIRTQLVSLVVPAANHLSNAAAQCGAFRGIDKASSSPEKGEPTAKWRRKAMGQAAPRLLRA
jgi:hypothetical protein